MTKTLLSFSFAAAAFVLAGCGPSSPAEQQTAEGSMPGSSAAPGEIACDELAGISSFCGFKNPEDLAVIPGGDFLLVSEMGAFMSDLPNTLSMLDIAQGERLPIAINWEPTEPRWGDVTCQPPEVAKFSPHGIDLITRADGRHAATCGEPW